MLPAETSNQLRLSHEQALYRYFEQRRDAVPGYVRENFSFRAILLLQWRCFKQDLVINLVNSYLALPLLTPKQIVLWLEKIGFKKAEGLSARLPSGFPTRFQREMEKSLSTQFFGSAGPFEAGTELDFHFRKLLKEEIRDLSRQRASTTDLLASVLPLGVGYLMFSRSAHSASEIGRRIASKFAHRRAVSHFFLGEKLGNAYYKLVPANPTKNEILIATSCIVVLFAVLTIVIHLLSAPAQNQLGVHERKLKQLLNSLEAKLLLEIHRTFKPVLSQSSET